MANESIANESIANSSLGKWEEVSLDTLLILKDSLFWAKDGAISYIILDVSNW